MLCCLIELDVLQSNILDHFATLQTKQSQKIVLPCFYELKVIKIN